MHRSTDKAALEQATVYTPSVFQDSVPSPFRDDILDRVRKAFDKYRAYRAPVGGKTSIALHELMSDPDFKGIVLDHVSQFSKSEAFDFATRLLGPSIALQLSASQISLQEPTAAAPMPLSRNPNRAGGDRPALCFWMALTDCGEDAPGLQVADDRTATDAALRMAAGDCVVFDQSAPYRIRVTPAMTKPCFSIELHGFPAEEMLRDPDRWMLDRAAAEVLIVSKGKQGIYLSHKNLTRIVTPQRGIFQFVRGENETDAERRDRERRLSDLAVQAEAEKPEIRTPQTMAAFLERVPDARVPLAGRCYVCPLGIDARALLPTLEGLPQTEILGLVDRQGTALPPFRGHHGISPQDLVDRLFDRVLVVHSSRARAEELTAQLLAAGVAQDKIIDLYGIPGYADFSVDWTLDSLDALLGDDPIDHVLLRAPGSYILGQAAVRALLPPERTLIVLVDEQPGAATIPGYKVIATQSCLRLVPRILQRLKPRTVLTQGWANTYFWSHLIKTVVPDVTMIVEMYDLWLAMAEYPVARFAAFCGISEQRMELYRLGEEYAFQHADLVVSKRFGEEWRKAVLHPDGAAYTPYFPHIEEDLIETGLAVSTPAGVNTENSPLTIVDATALVSADRMRQGPDVLVSYSPFALMEQLAATEPVRFDVFNGFHRRPDEDEQFAEYMSRYDRGAIRYHRGLPHAELIPRLSGFDYGWLNFPIPFDHPDPPFVALNRMTTYALAGLPIIVTKRLRFTADLVLRFNAGLVVEEATVEETRAALRRAAPVAHRAGIVALRNFMLDENRRALESIRRFL